MIFAEPGCLVAKNLHIRAGMQRVSQRGDGACRFFSDESVGRAGFKQDVFDVDVKRSGEMGTGDVAFGYDWALLLLSGTVTCGGGGSDE